MSERSPLPPSDVGLCPHGNFTESCGACLEETTKDVRDSGAETSTGMLLQERDPFDDFLAHIDGGQRREATAEEQEQMDLRLRELGALFEDSDIRWQLDGALNISLLRGGYIGIHKDVDISIEADEIEKIDTHLGKKGFGLFLSKLIDSEDPKSKRLMERVGGERFTQALEQDSFIEHAMIAAVDKRGKILESEGLNFIDVHVVRRIGGNPVGRNDVQLPEKWFEPIRHEFQGTELLLSHPAKVAYFKLRETRPYDEADLKLLVETEKVTKEDVAEIRKLVLQEKELREKRTETMMKRILGNINSEMGENQIFDQFISDPEISSKAGEKRVQEILKTLAKGIAQQTDRTYENLSPLFKKVLGEAGSYYQGILERLDGLENLAT